MRTIHVPTLPETVTRSRHGLYHSFSKDLSLALECSPPNDRLGSAPFSVRQQRVPFSASLFPLHAHTLHWDFYIVLSGIATVRVAGDLEFAASAAEAFVQPPGHVHQIINREEEDLFMVVVTNDAPADRVHLTAITPAPTRPWAIRPANPCYTGLL